MGRAHDRQRPDAWMIGRRFEIACEKLGFNKRRALDTPPPAERRNRAS